jgi:quinol monooxygenase YgiN
MITIVAKSILKPGKKEDFKVLIEELIRESRKEKGCISYNLYEDINNSNILTFIEEWRDEEAIKLHNESKHVTGIVPKLSELREGKSEINLYKLIEDKL